MNSLMAAAAALTTTVLIASGCASTDASNNTSNATSNGELVYRTGSNIPVREKPMTKEEKDARTAESQRALQQMQTTGAGNPKP